MNQLFQKPHKLKNLTFEELKKLSSFYNCSSRKIIKCENN